MSTFHLEIVTPTRVLDEGEVSYVRCPGSDGSFGVMAGHRAAIMALTVGEIKITKGGKSTYLATSGGFAEVTKGKVQILSETVERSEEIDLSRAELSLSRAKERLSKRTKEVDVVRADLSLMRALNRLKISKR